MRAPASYEHPDRHAADDHRSHRILRPVRRGCSCRSPFQIGTATSAQRATLPATWPWPAGMNVDTCAARALGNETSRPAGEGIGVGGRRRGRAGPRTAADTRVQETEALRHPGGSAARRTGCFLDSTRGHRPPDTADRTEVQTRKRDAARQQPCVDRPRAAATDRRSRAGCRSV